MQPEQSPAAPQPMGQPQAPLQQSQIVKTNKKDKVSVNPFRHFIVGNKQLFKTNIITAMLVSIASFVGYVGAVIGLTIVGALLFKDSFSSLDTIRNSVIKFIAFLFIAIIVVAVIASFVQLALIHTLIESTKLKKISVGEAFSFARRRFATAVKITLGALSLPFLAAIAFIVISIVGKKTPIITILAGLIFLLFILIYVFRILYIQYILADDEEPTTVRATIKRSSDLFSKSVWALVLYSLLTGIISSVISPNNSSQVATQTPNTNYSSCNYVNGKLECAEQSTKKVNKAAIGGVVVGSIVVSAAVYSFGSIIGSAGIVHIYAEAKEKLDGTAGFNYTGAGMSGAAGATPVPVAPQPFAPAPITSDPQVFHPPSAPEPSQPPVQPPTPPSGPIA